MVIATFGPSLRFRIHPGSRCVICLPSVERKNKDSHAAAEGSTPESMLRWRHRGPAGSLMCPLASLFLGSRVRVQMGGSRATFRRGCSSTTSQLCMAMSEVKSRSHDNLENAAENLLET